MSQDKSGDRELQREIENLTQRIAQLDRKLFDMSSLLQAGKAFDNTLEADPLFTIYTSIVNERFGLDAYAFFVLDDDKEIFQMVRGVGLAEDVGPDFSFPRREGLLWQTILQGRPFSTVDAVGQPRFVVPFQEFNLHVLRSRLFVPLVYHGNVVGLLSIGEKGDRCGYSDEDVDFLGILAEQASVSITTTQLYEKNQRDKAELDKTVKNLSILYNIGRALIHISDLKNLLKFILGQAIETTEAQKGSLMLWDANIGRLVVRVVKGLPDPKVEEAINSGEMECSTFAAGEGVAGQVFVEKEPMIINATDEDKRYEERDASNVNSILCTPLVANDEAIGVINITNKIGARGFSQEDLELLNALANQAAVAINNATLYEMAITDELTKIYIRRFFNLRLEAELKRAKRYGQKLSLAICDLDHFKSVNDNYGHQVGDEVLVQVAALLKSSLREIDVPARYGGEEFGVILPETDMEGALSMAERIRQSVAGATIEGLPKQITISIGLAEAPTHGVEMDELIRAADTALYRAKSEGRNRVCVYQENEKMPEKPEEE